jgi:D-alanine transaminase/branched-chain amino acid aminotransferase
MKELYCFIEGEIKKIEECHLSITDLGIQRGYGLFDFFRIKGNKPLFIEDHLERFFHSAKRMRMESILDIHELRATLERLINMNQLDHSGMKIILTGGDSQDGYSISKPRLCIVQNQLLPPPDQLPAAGIHLASWNYQRQLPDVKTTDYLMAIWLQPWMKERKADDILYHHDNVIRECPRSNIFIITNEGHLATPAEGMLSGITRKNIIRVTSKIGIPVSERNITLEQLKKSAGAFICSTTKRMMPVDHMDGDSIGNEASREIMQQIWNGLLEMEEAPR